MDSSRYLDGWSRSRSPGAPTCPLISGLTVAGQCRILTGFPWTSNTCIQLWGEVDHGSPGGVKAPRESIPS